MSSRGTAHRAYRAYHPSRACWQHPAKAQLELSLSKTWELSSRKHPVRPGSTILTGLSIKRVTRLITMLEVAPIISLVYACSCVIPVIPVIPSCRLVAVCWSSCLLSGVLRGHWHVAGSCSGNVSGYQERIRGIRKSVGASVRTFRDSFL